MRHVSLRSALARAARGLIVAGCLTGAGLARAAPPSPAESGTSTPFLTEKGDDVLETRFTADGETFFARFLYGSVAVWRLAPGTAPMARKCAIVLLEGAACAKLVESDVAEKHVEVVPLAAGAKPFKLPPSSDILTGLELDTSARGRLLLVRRMDSVDLLDARDGALVKSLPSFLAAEEKFGFSDDDRIVVASDAADTSLLADGQVRKIDTNLIGHATAIAFSRDSQSFVLFGSGGPQVIAASDGQPRDLAFPDDFSVAFEDSVRAGFLAKDTKIGMFGSGGDVGVWDLNANAVTKLAARAKATAFGRDRFVTLARDGRTIQLWGHDGQLVKTLAAGGREVKAVAISPVTDAVVVVTDNALVYWRP